MRTIYVLALAMLLYGCGESHEENATNDNEMENVEKTTPEMKAPDNVVSIFEASYPEAADVEWEQEGDMYEVNFELNGQDISALYDKDGILKETEEEIIIADLPDVVREAAVKNGIIKEATRIIAADGSIQYETEIEGKDFIYDEEGIEIPAKADKDDHADEDKD